MIKMKAFSVSEINKYIKRVLSTDPIVNHVLVEGEVSNFTKHSSGHAYFTLKDDFSKIMCVMFAGDLSQVDTLPKNGDKIQVKGQISVFERDGRYQLYAKELIFIGKGALYLQFEKMKEQMAAIGLFDPLKKKPLPKFPKKIAVITSPTGAALQDILSVAHRRGTFSEIIVIPSLVQGEQAPQDLINAIKTAHTLKEIELIIIARGGGSIEELWAFNNEALANCIFESTIPVISGVGHETDFTICDFVADKRAATPSAAAEIAIASREEIDQNLNKMLQLLVSAMQKKLQVEYMKLEALGLKHMKNKINAELIQKEQQVETFKLTMQNQVQSHLESNANQLQLYGEALSRVNPMAILLRGYSLVYKEDHLINSANQVALGDCLTIKTHDGTIDAVVKNTIITDKGVMD